MEEINDSPPGFRVPELRFIILLLIPIASMSIMVPEKLAGNKMVTDGSRDISPSAECKI